MNKGLKIVLISVGVATAIALPIVLVSRKKKRDEQQRKRDQEAQEKNLEQSTQTEASGEVTSGGSKYQGYIIPKRNYNNEVINPLSEIKGRKLFSAQDSKDPALGYPQAEGTAWVRSEAEVNTGTVSNALKQIKGAIGTVLETKKDNLSPSMRWFKVKLDKPARGVCWKLGFSYPCDKTEGWVRADVVTFAPYKSAKSNANGEMIERYKTDYQLGASVFPHSNWLNANETMASMNGNTLEHEGDNTYELGNVLNDL